MTRTNISARALELRAFGFHRTGWSSITTSAWMVTAFLVSVALAALVLAEFGAGEHGTDLALKATARWCFLLFWFAYAGGALAKLWASRFGRLARHGRQFGLAFAAALAVHVALVLWLLRITTGPNGSMLFFWIGAACTYLLALFSLPLFRDCLGLHLWRIFCTIALEYIALVFAVDFIVDPLQAAGYAKHPLSYLPFAIMLVGGAGLRFAALARGYSPTVAEQSR